MGRLGFFTLLISVGMGGPLAFAQPARPGDGSSWARSFGGLGDDRAEFVRKTDDGGFIAIGKTSSPFLGTNQDGWIVKLDASGALEWQKRYTTPHLDRGRAILQTKDGGFAALGYTDVTDSRIWLLKLDREGSLQWQRTYGGGYVVEAWALAETADGGYVVGGDLVPFGVGEPSNAWILKLNAAGAVEWELTYGGVAGVVSYTRVHSIEQTKDGGYVSGIETSAYGAGEYDLLVLKLDAAGGTEWQRTYGGPDRDRMHSVAQTRDGGYIVGGDTYSFGQGSDDIWVLKLDANGAVEWNYTYGGADHDTAGAVRPTRDGGYVVVGQLFEPDTTWNARLLKLDPDGAVIWQKKYGGHDFDFGASGEPVPGGYVIAGYTISFSATEDLWVLRTDANGDLAGCDLVGETAAVVGSTGVVGQPVSAVKMPLVTKSAPGLGVLRSTAKPGKVLCGSE